MAAVGGLKLGDEWRAPAGHETRFGVERRQAGKPRVDEPQFAPGAVGHFVDLDIAGDMTRTGQKARVVLPLRFEFRGDVWYVSEFPDLDRRADGEFRAAVG